MNFKTPILTVIVIPIICTIMKTYIESFICLYCTFCFPDITFLFHLDIHDIFPMIIQSKSGMKVDLVCPISGQQAVIDYLNPLTGGYRDRLYGNTRVIQQNYSPFFLIYYLL